MTIPPNTPNTPRLILPTNPPSLLVLPDGSIHKVPPDGSTHKVPPKISTRTDPGFFKQLVTELNPLRQTTRTGMVMSGLGLAALALEAVATLNLGNPFLFADRRQTWKDMSGRLEGGRSDVWRCYFDEVTPNWKGDAVDALQRHIRFNINGLYGQLGKVSDQSSTTMQGLYKEVLEYDLSLFALYAASAPVLGAVMKMSAHPMGKAALIAAVTGFAGLVHNLVSQFADVYNTYEGELNKQELLLNNLRGAFYNGGDPAQGPRDLNLHPSISDPEMMGDNWQRPQDSE
ncbi:hypothetical protein [Streptosporangium sp. KLBMP 9127]|nr:hypothetical protein [Streptosporangium sp. KLBMP 9127]